MKNRWKKISASLSVAMATLLTTSVHVFALNPDTGDNSNLPLVLGIGGGALLLVIILVALGGKKNKKKQK